MFDPWMDKLNDFNARRKADRAKQEEARQRLVGQLIKFGVCPCVAQGRSSTCCKIEDVE